MQTQSDSTHFETLSFVWSTDKKIYMKDTRMGAKGRSGEEGRSEWGQKGMNRTRESPQCNDRNVWGKEWFTHLINTWGFKKKKKNPTVLSIISLHCQEVPFNSYKHLKTVSSSFKLNNMVSNLGNYSVKSMFQESNYICLVNKRGVLWKVTSQGDLVTNS